MVPRTSVERLKRILNGDLDAIVLKALRKEPSERYASVADLAAEVLNVLERRPVAARRGGRRYRLKRFVARNQLAVGLGAFALLALLVAFGLALWQADLARRQAASAASEAVKSRLVLDFLLELFKSANPTVVERSDISARDLLEFGVERVQSQLAADPEAQVELLQAIAGAYDGIGLPRESVPLLQEVVTLRRQLAEPVELARA